MPGLTDNSSVAFKFHDRFYPPCDNTGYKVVSEFNNSFDIGLEGIDNVEIGEFNELQNFDIDSINRS